MSPYVHGTVVGEYRRYHKNGKLESIKTYAIDKSINRQRRHGVQKDYDDQGRLREEVHIRMDRRHGWKITYYGDGTVKEKLCFDDEKIVKSSPACK